MLHVKFGANKSNCLGGEEKFFTAILRMESYSESGRSLHHTIQLNSGNT